MEMDMGIKSDYGILSQRERSILARESQSPRDSALLTSMTAMQNYQLHQLHQCAI